jgi:Flp pilus assembly protein TadG
MPVNEWADAMQDTMTAIFTRACALLRGFAASRRGNVATMFAVALVPLMIATGVGLDYARAALVKSQIADALDAAALAVGSGGFKNKDDAQKAAQAIFDANYKGSDGTVVTVTNFDPKGSVTLSASAGVATTLLKMVDDQPIGVQTSSSVVWGQSKLWVALVLDNSGSMCQPDNQPCVNDTNKKSKIYQLKTATKTMLGKLQGASVNTGDVKVGIVPFNREVHVPFDSDGSSFSTTSSWIDWSFWEAAPAGVTISSNVGPGSNCPFSNSNDGFSCLKSASNGAATTSKVPDSGLICPGPDSGKSDTDRNDHYYNGCYTSVASVTRKNGDPTTKTVCSKDSSCTAKNYCSAYSKSSTNGNTVTTTTCECKSTGNNKPSCTTTAQPVTTTTGAPYTHTWAPNDHSTWSGCLTDRYSETHGTPATTLPKSDYDTQNIAPGSDTTGFTADNPVGGCPVAGVSALVNDSTSTDVTSLGTLVDKMQAAGSTNQAIGVAHGWQMLTKGDPYGTPGLPDNTSRYIILLSDGLNTQNRWWGDGSTEGTTQDGYIDARMKLTCDAAKQDGVIIYTLYVHVNGGGNSDPLQKCATDDAHYYDLTTADAINSAFADIAQKITNVRVSQ